MHIHITLVGGQTAPVYSGIIHSKADSVVLVCSKESRGEAERISSIVEVPCAFLELHPTDVSAIFRDVTAFSEGLDRDADLSVNLVGGTKPWSLVFYSLFKDRPSTRIELVDQNNRIWDFSARKWEDLPPVDIDTVFRLYGNPLVKSRKFTDYQAEDAAVAKRVEKYRSRTFSSKCFNHFNQLTAVLDPDWDKILQTRRSGLFSIDSGNWVEWNKDTGVVRILLTDKNGQPQEAEFQSPQAVNLVFNSGWFEFKVAAALSTWKRSCEIRLNCLFPLSENQDSNIKNEVDVVVSTGRKLLFFECKTKLFRPLDVDKFASVVKNYGGMGTKGILVTWEPVTEQALKKCDEYGLLYFCIKDHFQLDKPKNWQKHLIDFLEASVDSVNKK